MSKTKQMEELKRLIKLISDDEELLIKANHYMQKLEETKSDLQQKRGNTQ